MFTLGNLRIKRTILHSLRDIIAHEFLLQTKIFFKKSTKDFIKQNESSPSDS